METIVSAYGINESDKQQRYRLKQRLLNEYKEQLLFIFYEKHSPKLVISKDCLEKQNLTNILETSRSVQYVYSLHRLLKVSPFMLNKRLKEIVTIYYYCGIQRVICVQLIS